MPERTSKRSPGKHAYEGLDRALHEKARLGIMTSLLAEPQGLCFNDLKEVCSLTDGNLSRHLQVLSEAGLVEIWKGYENNRPQTLCRLSAKGRERFLEYLEELEKVLQHAADVSKQLEAQRVNPMPPGWSRA
jgi:DNA-binding transcriptional ArsR family regulator